MNTKYRLIFAGLVFSAGTSLFAQNAKKDSTLNQSMTIERDFSPIVRDANKIDQMPAALDIKVKKSPTRYSDWIAGEAQSSEIGRMPVGQVIVTDDPYKLGYVELSAGNYFNTDLKAGLNLGEFSVDLDGFFTKGDLDLPEEYFNLVSSTDSEDTWSSRLLNGNIKLGYDHRFYNDSRIRAHVGVGGYNYNMFSVIDPEKQKVGRLFADVIYDYNDATFELGFTHSGLSIPDLSDNTIKFKAGYGWYYETGWQLKTALNMGMQFAEKNYFTVKPEVEFSRFGLSGLSRFYINATGGISRPNFYEVMEMMPLAIPNEYSYSTEKQIFDITLGYENNELGNFKWGAYLAGGMILDRLDAYMAYSNHEDYTYSYPKLGDNAYGILTRSDEFEARVGLYFDFEHNRYFGAKGGVYVNTNPRFGGSVFNLDMHLLSNPIDKLYFDLSFNGGFNRKMVCDLDEDFDLGSIYDLGFRADYKFKDNLSFFLFGKNLAACEYQLWPIVPAQKVNVHAGFSWRF